jgi:hypothetical protein
VNVNFFQQTIIKKIGKKYLGATKVQKIFQQTNTILILQIFCLTTDTPLACFSPFFVWLFAPGVNVSFVRADRLPREIASPALAAAGIANNPTV